ncbi:hypothetical protein K7H20_23025 [Salipiger manganoxidans]|uniref:hypothetical protein n=1 Tax=Salipiger marinus TaxID=555512 RepID=UPI001E3D6F99|nr:hypothetical protein [Salipiger manganoxidans]MCD1620931.1 hypothetical protein [Salipiger manganoxidans]
MTYSDVSRRIVKLYRKLDDNRSSIDLAADPAQRDKLKQERDKLHDELRTLEEMLQPV